MTHEFSAPGPGSWQRVAQSVIDRALAKQGMSRTQRRETLAHAKQHYAEQGTDQMSNEILAKLADNFEAFKRRNDARLDALHERMDEIEALGGRIPAGGVGGNIGEIAEAKAEFSRFVKSGIMPDGVSAGMMVGSDPDGGYLVSPFLDPTIAKYAQDVSPMRRRCRLVRLTRSDEFQIPFNTENTAAGWVGETESRPATDAAKVARFSIFARELYAMPEVTQKLLDDSAFDIDAFIRDEVIRAFADLENPSFISGNGVSQPKGLLTYDTSTDADADRALGTIQYVPTGQSAGFPALSGVPGAADADCLVTTVYSLKAEYRAKAVWMMNSTTAGTVRKLKDGDGRHLWVESISEGQPPMLMGHPVELNEDMPNVGSDTMSIAFGDFSRAYTIVDRQGVRLLRDPYTNKPYVRFYTTKRVGGGLVDSRAVKLVKFSAS